MTIRILLADADASVRQILRSLLEREGLQVVGEAEDGPEAVRLARVHAPDVAILDMAIPRQNGFESGREIVRTRLGIRVILLTMDEQNHQFAAALRAGLHGCIVKTDVADHLVEAVHSVHTGGIYLGKRAPRAV